MLEFIHCCEEMAEILECAIADHIGNPSGGNIVRMGADGTPTKRIDEIAEDVIIEYLQSHRLCNKLISEEKGVVQLGGNEGTIFLDPIDGTFNAVSGIPFFALSIAYAHDGDVQAGYVKDLAHGECFSAVKGRGAYLNGRRIRVSGTKLLEKSTMSLYGRKFNPATVLRLGRKIRRWRLLGASAIELCYVASGRLDGFVDLRGTLRVTDAIAGMLICREAGGIVTDNHGDHLEFSEQITVGKCLVATNGTVHQKVIQYLQE